MMNTIHCRKAQAKQRPAGSGPIPILSRAYAQGLSTSGFVRPTLRFTTVETLLQRTIQRSRAWPKGAWRGGAAIFGEGICDAGSGAAIRSNRTGH